MRDPARAERVLPSARWESSTAAAPHPRTRLDPCGAATAAGWGPYGARNDDQDSFRYVCQVSGEGYAGQVQLIVSSNPSWLRQTMDTLTHQPDSKVQDNTVTTVESGGHTVHVLKRWYPTNPQGEYQAAFLDERAGAIVLWDINSLNKADFHTYSPQQAADDLMGLLRTE